MRVALTFPGQGSQRPGMGEPWRDTPQWSLVGQASNSLGLDLEQVLLTADAEELRTPQAAQISTFLLSMLVLAAARPVLHRTGAQVVAVAGHSLGEFSALVAAGALDLADGLRVVGVRGHSMDAAAQQRPGVMAAVLGLPAEQVEEVIGEQPDCWLANLNGGGQAVITGTEAGVTAASEALLRAGARRVMALPVGGAFHSPLMQTALPALKDVLNAVAWAPAEVPVVCNTDAVAHQDLTEWPGLLARQLLAPVRWAESLHTLADLGAQAVVELGPGAVLTGMAKREVPAMLAVSAATPAEVDALPAALAGSVA